MSPILEKFVDPLPIIKKAKPIRRDRDGASYYEVSMEPFTQKLHRDLQPTPLWGYNRQFPGPTFDVNRGEVARVKWKNKLPDKHFLPIDQSIHHGHGDMPMPEVRTVTHLHGSETPWESDGFPEAWYTKDFKQVGPFFRKEIYEYPNHQRGCTLWYHDHAMGLTRLNVYSGLAGMYIIRDEEEKKLRLPKDEYELPLVITDRSFQPDGSLFYPSQPDNPSDGLPNPSIRPFFLGDTILVNGKVWPYLKVEPRKYRFRLLNASNTRSYTLYLDPGLPFYQIGTDGGLLAKTVKINQIEMTPGERIDLILDFTHFKGKTITLKNDLGEDPDPEDQTGDVMQFKVELPLKNPDTSRIPKVITTIPSLKKNPISTLRNLKLVGSTDEFGRPLLLLNGKKWSDPVTENPKLGSTELWSLVNVTNVTHPIHIHLIQFQILERQPFDLERYNQDGQILFTGPATPPKPSERGWKDMVRCPPNQVTRIIARFAPYPGNYVWHCHVLEHEDYDMMRPIRVIDPKKKK
ncbi:multicopper oxidase [Mesobacillus maritimus]|uniref:multicopper oxidase family protein n=1 Tax=Mesobacillus maritimus TaxID=1643336 RepID=UPI0020418D7E|nr:multicopper oxidase [Mesobacillus maritimus]MCM3586739.1 multicopper oxidase [Mesobacillus maritimus]MCM3668506.1 multicopper oxidase [Mesobacillus maritimus]